MRHRGQFKNSNGFEYWNEYDENKNKIHYKDTKNQEYWWKYDENKNMISCKNSDGFEQFYNYDEDGNLTVKEIDGEGNLIDLGQHEVKLFPDKML